jgi:hypothetical protein
MKRCLTPIATMGHGAGSQPREVWESPGKTQMQSANRRISVKNLAQKYEYLRRAQKRFLAGTKSATPELAVSFGERTIEQWADIVQEELERDSQRVLTSFQPGGIISPVSFQVDAHKINLKEK